MHCRNDFAAQQSMARPYLRHEVQPYGPVLTKNKMNRESKEVLEGLGQVIVLSARIFWEASRFERAQRQDGNLGRYYNLRVTAKQIMGSEITMSRKEGICREILKLKGLFAEMYFTDISPHQTDFSLLRNRQRVAKEKVPQEKLQYAGMDALSKYYNAAAVSNLSRIKLLYLCS
uniref:Uncharacterized protein n=1 Tax=Romanomermis culicivorax TaxID=13658 RepID=A0A915KSD3_ROMCU